MTPARAPPPPPPPPPPQGLSFVHNDLGQRDEAIAAMRAAIALKPLEQYHTALATLLPDTDLAAKIAELDAGLQLAPTAMLPFCLRAEYYALAARWPELARDHPRLVQLVECGARRAAVRRRPTPAPTGGRSTTSRKSANRVSSRTRPPIW